MSARRDGHWSPSCAHRRVRDGVAEIFGVEPHALMGRSRRKPLVGYRHVAFWVVHQCFPALTFPMVGTLFGGRDHSTVIYGCQNVDYRRERDASFRELTDAIRDGFGVRSAPIEFDQAIRARIEALCSRVQDLKAVRAAEEDPPIGASRAVLPRNDFSQDDSDARLRRKASDALGDALAREGMVCR